MTGSPVDWRLAERVAVRAAGREPFAESYLAHSLQADFDDAQLGMQISLEGGTEDCTGRAGAHAGHGGAGGAASQRPARCDNPNRPVVTFAIFDPEKDVVVADVAALLARTDVTVNQPGTALGCLSAADDRDCAGVMAAFGLPAGTQTFFRTEASR